MKSIKPADDHINLRQKYRTVDSSMEYGILLLTTKLLSLQYDSVMYMPLAAVGDLYVTLQQDCTYCSHYFGLQQSTQSFNLHGQHGGCQHIFVDWIGYRGTKYRQKTFDSRVVLALTLSVICSKFWDAGFSEDCWLPLDRSLS